MKLTWTADTWISFAGVVIALAVGVPALMQARSAKRQLALMQREYNDRRADNDEASGPVFTVQEAHLVQAGEVFAEIKLVMASGRPAKKVTITARGKDVRCLARWAGSHDPLEEKIWTDASPGAVIEVTAQLEWEHENPANVTLDLICEEAGGQHRRWFRSVTAAATQPPPPPDDGQRWRRLNR